MRIAWDSPFRWDVCRGSGGFGHPAALRKQRPAVDDRRRTSDVGGCIRCEEHGRSGDVLGTSQATGWNALLEDASMLVAAEIGRRGSRDHARLHAIDGDV